MINRRKFMSLFAIGTLGPGLVNAMSHSGTVAKVKESDDNAKALKYVEVSAEGLERRAPLPPCCSPEHGQLSTTPSSGACYTHPAFFSALSL